MKLWRFFDWRRNSALRTVPDRLSGLSAPDALHVLSGAMFYRAWMGEPPCEAERAALRARGLDLDDPVAALDRMTLCAEDAAEAGEPTGMRGSMLAMKTLLGSWKIAEPANGLIATAIDDWYALELAKLGEKASAQECESDGRARTRSTVT